MTAGDVCPACWTATHPDPKDHPMIEIVYAVHHPRLAFPGETRRASYGARHEAPTDLGAFAAELAEETRIAHSWTGPLTVSLWPPREDEHYGLPVPSNAAVFTFPAVEDPR